MKLPIQSLSQTRFVTAPDDCLLGTGVVKETTGLIDKQVPHKGHFPLVLGHSWLVPHKPQVNWDGQINPILQWGAQCASHCLQISSPISGDDGCLSGTSFASDDEEIGHQSDLGGVFSQPRGATNWHGLNTPITPCVMPS